MELVAAGPVASSVKRNPKRRMNAVLLNRKNQFALSLAATLLVSAGAGTDCWAFHIPGTGKKATAEEKRAASAAKQAAKDAKKAKQKKKYQEDLAAEQAAQQMKTLSAEAQSAIAQAADSSEKRELPAVITPAPAPVAVPMQVTPHGTVTNVTPTAEVNLNDSKVSAEEKRIDEQNRAASDARVNEQAAAANRIPGTKVDPEDLKEEGAKKKGGLSLNPITWLFKPVLKLQEQSVRLEQQIMKLTGPIAALQPSMLKLEQKMDGVQGTMGNMQNTLKGTESTMQSVQKSMGGVTNQIGGMKTQVVGVRQDMRSIQGEMNSINKDINQLRDPIEDLRSPLMAIQKPIAGVEQRLSKLDQQLADLKALITMVLTSIYIAAAVVAIGTPAAAILVWRHRAKILPKASPSEKHEEAKLAAAGAEAKRQDADAV